MPGWSPAWWCQKEERLGAELLAEEHAERALLAAVNAEADFSVRALLKDILRSLAKSAARDVAAAEAWVELLAAVVQGGSCWGAAERVPGGPGLDAVGGGSMVREGFGSLAMAEEGRLEDEAEAVDGRSGRLEPLGMSGALSSPRAPAVRSQPSLLPLCCGAE